MSAAVRLVVAGFAVLALAVAGMNVLRPTTEGPGMGGTSPSPMSASPSLQSSASPSASSSAEGRLDTADWVGYTSQRYDFTLRHPAEWTVQPATRDWALDVDARDWRSNGQESFVAPNDDIRVGAWSVATDGGTTLKAGEIDVEAWVEAYCEASANTPCTGIAERAVPLCLEWRDCHPGLLLAFKDDVQAFFTNGSPGTPMVVVAVWWGESAPAVAPYGGSRRLLEAFLSTMCVWPEDARPPLDVAATDC